MFQFRNYLKPSFSALIIVLCFFLAWYISWESVSATSKDRAKHSFAKATGHWAIMFWMWCTVIGIRVRGSNALHGGQSRAWHVHMLVGPLSLLAIIAHVLLVNKSKFWHYMNPFNGDKMSFFSIPFYLTILVSLSQFILKIYKWQSRWYYFYIPHFILCWSLVPLLTDHLHISNPPRVFKPSTRLAVFFYWFWTALFFARMIARFVLWPTARVTNWKPIGSQFSVVTFSFHGFWAPVGKLLIKWSELRPGSFAYVAPTSWFNEPRNLPLLAPCPPSVLPAEEPDSMRFVVYRPNRPSLKFMSSNNSRACVAGMYGGTFLSTSKLNVVVASGAGVCQALSLLHALNKVRFLTRRVAPLRAVLVLDEDAAQFLMPLVEKLLDLVNPKYEADLANEGDERGLIEGDSAAGFYHRVVFVCRGTEASEAGKSVQLVPELTNEVTESLLRDSFGFTKSSLVVFGGMLNSFESVLTDQSASLNTPVVSTFREILW